VVHDFQPLFIGLKMISACALRIFWIVLNFFHQTLVSPFVYNYKTSCLQVSQKKVKSFQVATTITFMYMLYTYYTLIASLQQSEGIRDYLGLIINIVWAKAYLWSIVVKACHWIYRYDLPVLFNEIVHLDNYLQSIILLLRLIYVLCTVISYFFFQ